MVAPTGIVSTGWPAVRDTCHRLGWGFDGWQDGSGRLILSKRADGSYAADTVVISIPRQVGKTYLIACIIFALCLLQPKLKVIWTAHRKSTSAETFRQFDGMSKRPKVAPHIRQVLRGKGDESIWFDNGSSIEFGARESGFGRGRTDVDVLVFDEGQILPESTLEDMGAAQNVARNPLTFVMGTPPRPKDDGEFFTLLRQEALDGESEGTLYIEMSADRGANPMDRAQWRKANASYPLRTTERAMLRLRKKLKNPDSWNREALGIWDEIQRQFSPFNGALWAESVDVGPTDGTKPNGFAIDMSHDRRISVLACWVEDESVHVEEVWSGIDEPACVEWVTGRWRAAGRRTKVLIDSQSPAASMIPTLTSRKVNVHVGSAGDMAKACGLTVAKLEHGLLTHADQVSVNEARDGCRKRGIGQAGGWGLDRSDPSVHIAPMVATVEAVLAATMTKRTTTGAGRSSSRGRAGVVM